MKTPTPIRNGMTYEEMMDASIKADQAKSMGLEVLAGPYMKHEEAALRRVIQDNIGRCYFIRERLANRVGVSLALIQAETAKAVERRRQAKNKRDSGKFGQWMKPQK